MKEKQKTKKINRIIFGVLLMLLCSYFFLGEYILPREHTGAVSNCALLQTDWVWVHEDGSREPITIPGGYDVERGAVMTVEAVVPDYVEDNEWIRFRSLRQDIEVFIGDELRVSYSTKDTRLFGVSSSGTYVYVRMKSSDAGKVLRLQIQNGTTYSGVLHSVYYGDLMGFWMSEIRVNGMQLLIAAITLLLGIFSIFVSLVMHKIYRTKIAMKYLGFGVILAALWIILNSSFRELICPNLSVASDVTFLLVALMPVPFLFYFDDVQGNVYHRIYQITEGIHLVIVVGCTLLHLLKLVDFSVSIRIITVGCVLSIATLLYTVVMDVWKKRIHTYRAIAMGLFGGVVCALLQIYVYFSSPNNTFLAHYFAVGLIFLLFAAMLSTVNNLVIMDREKRQAILASESKARFLANMSHEIRTPINAVLGMDEMILQECKDPIILDYAKDIQNAGKSLLSLINDILDFSKIESGKLELVPVEYQLSSLLNDCYNMVHLRAMEKNLSFVVENNEHLPCTVYGDEVRVRQIVINLLTNAIKYTKQGKISVYLEGEIEEDGRIRLEISVQDTGIGIKDEDISKLFTSFQRVDEKKNRNVEGTGLGLAITQQLVQQMDGEIRVASEYGKGSVFTAVIRQRVVDSKGMGPFHIHMEEETPDKEESVVKTPAQNEDKNLFTASKARILVVDDVAMNLKVFKGLVKKLNMQVDTAESGMDALKQMEKNKYDLIFLDHMMPQMDGVETYQHMKEMEHPNQNIPVIMLTANAIAGVREEYLSEGFTDYLSKPVNREALFAMIYKYLPKEKIES